MTMKATLFSLALVCSAGVVPGQAAGQPAAPARQQKIGQIFIVGNEVTRSSVVLEALGLYPGQVLRPEDLRAAEKNLARLGIFTVDPARGIRPTVTVTEGDGEFSDILVWDDEISNILVRVEEAPTGSMRIEPGVGSRGEPVIRVVLEERNFDITRFPTSVDDLLSGQSFRGAGQPFCLTLLEVPLPGLRAPWAYGLLTPEVRSWFREWGQPADR
jgi:outer membrane protein assembly factor BamA